ncbi:hypothetical protein HZC00_03010 [Candidatus Kaiserbacteria bacterium]|nr:hypothetical protein [Candidatus Kaiserbacteria bacterium]
MTTRIKSVCTRLVKKITIPALQCMINMGKFFEPRPGIWGNELFAKLVKSLDRELPWRRDLPLDVLGWEVGGGQATNDQLQDEIPLESQCDLVRAVYILRGLVEFQLDGKVGPMDCTGTVYRLVLQDFFIEFFWSTETRQWRFYAYESKVHGKDRRRVDLLLIPGQMDV